MIFDHIKNCERYYGLHPEMKKAFEAVKEAQRQDFSVGKYPIDGEKVFLKVQEYSSKKPEDGKFENHIKYIDIQYVIDGEEKILVADCEHLERTVPYSAEKEVEFTVTPPCVSETVLHAGEFAILYPGEAHCPGLAVDGQPKTVHKILVKIAK